ncbi:MAG: acyl-CoA synthetase FdrA [Chloroflexota bacterium]
MASGYVVRKQQYYDSIFLMGVNKRLSENRGVLQTAVLMGSEKNKQLLADIGIHGPQIDSAGPNDLIVAIIADTPQIVEAVLGKLDEALDRIQAGSIPSVLHTLEEGLAQKPNANLAVISIPGEYAAHEARKALEAGLNVFLFSSNVSIEDELDLKQCALQNNLLVMGPDCGTSLLGGIGIGFANIVRRGPIGVIGAAGTGLQEFTSQIHNAGLGISHAIGTGSHDVSDEIEGITTFTALERLEADSQTKVIVFISKPLGAKTFTKLVERLQGCRKPAIGCFLGQPVEPLDRNTNLQCARTIDEAVQLAAKHVTGSPLPPIQLTSEELEWAAREKAGWSPEQKYLRGVFAGGTFCYQSQQILRDAGFAVHSNAPFAPQNRLSHPDQSLEHTLLDMGDDYYTLGKPHPMINGTLRVQRILTESLDHQVAILLLDFILGYNASTDPVGELLDAILEARQRVRKRGGSLTVVASICGTEDDPQDLNLQTQLLKEAGAIVFRSNARATLFCCELLKHPLGGAHGK